MATFIRPMRAGDGTHPGHGAGNVLAFAGAVILLAGPGTG